MSSRNILGYLLGALLFVALMPTLMWLASGMPQIVHIGDLRASVTGLLIIGGLSLSVWTIVYMKRRGKGNPMDAFGHEVAPRTQHLMTEGPYRLNRNPMLTGTLTYLAGFVVWLWTWQSAVVWVAFSSSCCCRWSARKSACDATSERNMMHTADAHAGFRHY